MRLSIGNQSHNKIVCATVVALLTAFSCRPRSSSELQDANSYGPEIVPENWKVVENPEQSAQGFEQTNANSFISTQRPTLNKTNGALKVDDDTDTPPKNPTSSTPSSNIFDVSSGEHQYIYKKIDLDTQKINVNINAMIGGVGGNVTTTANKDFEMSQVRELAIWVGGDAQGIPLFQTDPTNNRTYLSLKGRTRTGYYCALKVSLAFVDSNSLVVGGNAGLVVQVGGSATRAWSSREEHNFLASTSWQEFKTADIPSGKGPYIEDILDQCMTWSDYKKDPANINRAIASEIADRAKSWVYVNTDTICTTYEDPVCEELHQKTLPSFRAWTRMRCLPNQTGDQKTYLTCKPRGQKDSNCPVDGGANLFAYPCDRGLVCNKTTKGWWPFSEVSGTCVPETK